MIRFFIYESDVEAVMQHKRIGKAEAERFILNRFLCSGVECCGMNLVNQDDSDDDDPDMIDLVSEPSDFENVLHKLESVRDNIS